MHRWAQAQTMASRLQQNLALSHSLHLTSLLPPARFWNRRTSPGQGFFAIITVKLQRPRKLFKLELQIPTTGNCSRFYALTTLIGFNFGIILLGIFGPLRDSFFLNKNYAGMFLFHDPIFYWVFILNWAVKRRQYWRNEWQGDVKHTEREKLWNE